MSDLRFPGAFEGSTIQFGTYQGNLHVFTEGCHGGVLTESSEARLLYWLRGRQARRDLTVQLKRYNPCPENCPFCPGDACKLCPQRSCEHDFIDRHGWRI